MKAVAEKEASWTTCSTFSYSVKKSSGSHMSTLPSVSKIYQILVFNHSACFAEHRHLRAPMSAFTVCAVSRLTVYSSKADK